MHRFLRHALCALLVIAAVPAANAGTCYVTTAGSNANSGASWASPYDLQTALGAGPCTEIWVAAGIYKPTPGSDRTISFGVRPGVAVYGGFSGTETRRGQRDSAANLTVLSGDLNGDDTDVNAGNGVDVGVSANNVDNSYTIVMMNGTGAPITSSTPLLSVACRSAPGVSTVGSAPSVVMASSSSRKCSNSSVAICSISSRVGPPAKEP